MHVSSLPSQSLTLGDARSLKNGPRTVLVGLRCSSGARLPPAVARSGIVRIADRSTLDKRVSNKLRAVRRRAPKDLKGVHMGRRKERKRSREVEATPAEDPTQGRELGSTPAEDPTQGRELGSTPAEDPTQGRELGSTPAEDSA
jgi:hypothetical protein